MTPTVTAALRTRARAEVRCEVALMQYRDARRRWRYIRSYVNGPSWEFHDARIARARWTMLADLLAADAVETTVAA